MGQPNLGDRVLIQSRPPRLVWEEVTARAKAAGQPVSRYVAALLAEHVGRPDLAPPRPQQQEALAM